MKPRYDDLELYGQERRKLERAQAKLKKNLEDLPFGIDWGKVKPVSLQSLPKKNGFISIFGQCEGFTYYLKGGVDLSDRNFEAFGRGDCEIEDHAPRLVLGISYKELIRIDMTDDLTTTTKGEAVYSEEGKRKEFGTDYLVALKDWGRFESEPSVLAKVIDVIKNCERELGAATLAYSVKSEQYVAIRFEKAPEIGSVFVNRGFVDHRVELSGSHWNKTHDIWRTNLPTGSNSAASHKKLPEIKHLTCKMCFQQYPASMSGCPVCTQAD